MPPRNHMFSKFGRMGVKSHFVFSKTVSTFIKLNYPANICNNFIKTSKCEELFSN